LAHHFTQAALTDAAIEWWGKAGDQALRRSAFQEAISHLGKAIEMADKESGPLAEVAPGAASERQKPAAARQRRLQLQVGLANALLQSRGQHSSETKSAFDKARELASGIDDPLQRFSTYYGLWAGGYVRGERAIMIEAAEALIRESDAWPDSAEAGIANRIHGVTCWIVRDDLTTARKHLERAVALYRPERDRELAHRFAQDVGVAARAYLSLVLWGLGESDRARAVMSAAMSLAAETKHAPTLVYAYYHAAVLEAMRFDPVRAKYTAETCLALAREHRVEYWTLVAPLMVAWANADWEEMDRSLTVCRERDLWVVRGFGCPLLAAGQSLAGQVESALATADQAIAEAEQRGLCFFLAEAHHIRGEILLKRDSANTAPAEEAFLTAIAIAQQQKAKSFELRAALSLAKLYQSTGRAADAQAVLARALEGFSPTPEFPEIAEAQALLATLTESDEVKNAAAARQRRLKLQTSYSQAVMWSKGFGAEETKAAFIRARELAAAIDDANERFTIYYGLYAGNMARGELGFAREIAETFLREAERGSRTTECGYGRALLGHTCLRQGDFIEAQSNLLQALSIYDPERDREARFRFGQDHGAAARVYLAITKWQLGEVGPARALIEEAVAQARETNHVPTLVNTYFNKAHFEIVRGDAGAARRDAEIVVKLGHQNALRLYAAWGALQSAWASARLDDHETGAAELRQALAAFTDQGNKVLVPFFQGLLAQIEAQDDAEGALTRLDQALALAGETGERWNDARLYQCRGEILLQRDAANTAPAEDSFLAAIAIAQQQKAKSFELRAALSLAKLYQSTGRAADAHAVLAPALEGFSPTPEFPEIEQAQRLIGSLGS
jgi:predicted ATPase